MFYLLYAVFFFSGRVWQGLTLWGAAIIISSFLGGTEIPLLAVLFAPINIEFIAGAIIATIFLRGWQVRALPAFGVAGAFLLAFIFSGAERSESWLIGFAMAAVVLWVCHLERAVSFKVPSWLVTGGAASYAIYLVHNPLLSVISRAFAYLGAGWFVSLWGSVLISAAAGVAYWWAWERPIMRLSRRGWSKAAPTAQPT